MQNLLNDLKGLLENDNRFVSENALLKNQIIEHALKNDEALIKLLLTHDKIKKHFFFEVAGTTIFDKEKFMRFVSSKNFLPDSYTSFKNKIGLAQGDEYLKEQKKISLIFPHKDCVLEGGQGREDEKKNEIFYNEILAPDDIDRLLEPKVLTGFKKYTAEDEKGMDEIDFDKDNFVIKGNNLLALHSLKKRFAGKVKLIYIDPPYNTGNDSFHYNDAFNHSSWLTFMKNRLEVAKELLRDDGVIFVSLDDKENHYCKILMDDIFGRENFIADICHKSRASVSNDKIISPNHNHILLFARNERIVFKNKHLFGIKKNLEGFNLNDKNGDYKLVPVDGPGGASKGNPYYEFLGIEGYWRFSKSRMSKMYENELIVKKGNSLYQKYYKEKAKESKQTITTWWDDGFLTSTATSELKQLMGDSIFNNPKSVNLLKRIIELWCNDNDLVLDYFSGSGTTAQAVLELNKEDNANRRFILVEQMEYDENLPISRIQKVIERYKEGSFAYLELKKWNQNWLEKIREAKDTPELLKIWEKIQAKPFEQFINWHVSVEDFNANIESFLTLEFEKQQKALTEILNKNWLYVPYSEIEDEDFQVSEIDKKLNNKFYNS